jgi:hypothetical protein
MEKPTKGGKREGSGRPPVTYETKLIQFRVPAELAEEIKRECRIIIKSKTIITK